MIAIIIIILTSFSPTQSIDTMDNLCAAVEEQRGCTKNQTSDGCNISCPNGGVICSMAYKRCSFTLGGSSGSIPIDGYPSVCGVPI